MTKKLFIFLMSLMVVLSCDQANKKHHKGNDDDDDQEMVDDDDDDGDDDDDEFSVKTLTYHYDQNKIEVDIQVDYPTGGPEAIVNAVSEYVSETLGGSYEGSLKRGQQVIDFYGQQMQTELTGEYTSQCEDVEEEYIEGFYRKYNVRFAYETEKLITYTVEEEIYMNGAHGVEYSHGQTFRKSDGRRFAPDMMKDLYSDGMYSLRKEGLRSYFAEFGGEPVSTDEELKDYIITEDDVDYLPMPRCTPFFLKEGLHFVYQPYEISFYSAGQPQFTLTYSQVKPYLKASAQQMLE